MKTRTIFCILITAILCLASFWLGRSQSRLTSTYDQNALAVDEALLVRVRAGNITNVIPDLEAMLDLEILGAMHYGSMLQGQDRDILNLTLDRVAAYRQQYPRPIMSSTNGISPLVLKQAETWAEEQREIDAFLLNYAVTNK